MTNQTLCKFLQLSVEEVKERQQKLARMRSLLFQHEVQAKRIKKIKSKTYHRLLQKSQKRKAESDATVDPEAAKDVALKQEFKRAQVCDLLMCSSSGDILSVSSTAWKHL